MTSSIVEDGVMENAQLTSTPVVVDEEGSVAVSSPVDDEDLVEERFFYSMGSSREELERQALVIARPYIEAEREACAALVEDVACNFLGGVIMSTGEMVIRDMTVRQFVELADLIRGRK